MPIRSNSFPTSFPKGGAGHAKTVIFLTADAFGVLPPISRLALDATMYHFLSGFTSKLAGTEAGLGDEPDPASRLASAPLSSP